MMYTFSPKELGFWCVIFDKPLPSILKDPFESLSQKQVQEEWVAFCRKFSQNGLLNTDSEGNIDISENLHQTLMCCFAADTVISIMEDNNINDIFYLGLGNGMLLSCKDNLYNLQLLATPDDYKNAFLNIIKGKEIYDVKQSKEFFVKVTAEQFENLLDWYNSNKNKSIQGLCYELDVDFDVCMSILECIHLSNTVILTERINKPGTIITKVASTRSDMVFAKSIYTESQNITVLSKCIPKKLTDVIINFMED